MTITQSLMNKGHGTIYSDCIDANLFREDAKLIAEFFRKNNIKENSCDTIPYINWWVLLDYNKGPTLKPILDEEMKSLIEDKSSYDLIEYQDIHYGYYYQITYQSNFPGSEYYNPKNK